MKPIPHLIRKACQEDSYYRRCCLTGKEHPFVKIDWHHAWEYAGSQINEKWAIMPVWWYMHARNGSSDSVHNSTVTRELVQWLSINRATKKDLSKYPKKDWNQIYNYLEKKYGCKKSCS